jgi:class 3 adenylate cyclase
MVAGGLTATGDHVRAVAEWALDALDYIKSCRTLAPEPICLHVGICTGPVAAGVIGARRFIYDLWGNTVNVASRLSDEAPAGGVLVDQHTHDRLVGRYRFSAPCSIRIKGKGPMIVYRLEGRVGSSAAAAPSFAKTLDQSAETAEISPASASRSTRA